MKEKKRIKRIKVKKENKTNKQVARAIAETIMVALDSVEPTLLTQLTSKREAKVLTAIAHEIEKWL